MTYPVLIQTSSSLAVYFDSYDAEQAPQLAEVLPSGGALAQWLSLVAGIRTDDPTAVEELYSILYQSIRPSMIRRLGLTEADDRFHDTVLIVMGAIRSNSLRDPARLMGFVQTVARRQMGASIRAEIKRRQTTAGEHFNLRSGCDLEDEFSRHEEKQLAKGILDALSLRHREILVRFYVDEQSTAAICADMGLTETQFRLLKWRAKARLTTLCRGKLSRNRLPYRAATNKA